MIKEELTKLLMEAYERGQSDLIKSCHETVSIAVDTAILAEREACANIADRLPRTYRETKEAHERATLEPFHPSRFGFDFAELKQAEVITHAIRARGQA